MEKARAAVAEAKANGPFWYGDFWPLTCASLSSEVWQAFQFHRADLRAGILLAFRRAECPYPAFQTALRALEPGATYAVETIDDSRERTTHTVSGSKLMTSWEIKIPRKGSSLLVRYRAQ